MVILISYIYTRRIWTLCFIKLPSGPLYFKVTRAKLSKPEQTRATREGTSKPEQTREDTSKPEQTREVTSKPERARAHPTKPEGYVHTEKTRSTSRRH